MRNRVFRTPAIVLGALLILASSPAWSQDRGGVVPSEAPRPVTLSSGTLQEAGGLTLRPHRRPAPTVIQPRIIGPTLGVFTPPFGTSDGSVVSLRFVIIQQNGQGGQELVTWIQTFSDRFSLGRR